MSQLGPKTSENDPLRVDFLAAADLGLPGRVGLTIAPGKKDLRRSWDRDLDADLARLAGIYETRLLVSLLEEPEYRLLKIPDLHARCAAAGIETLSFPIPDVDAPPPAAMGAFVTLVRKILAAAGEGRTVVIHCRGGLGRSGTVAAACLVARGHAPREAIARVRAARPNAVEVPAQERFVAMFAEAWSEPPGPRREARPSLDAFVGCLLGGALGDALGYPVEFQSGREILRRYGAAPPAELNHGGGALALVSDDTQLTLFTAEGVIRVLQRFADRGLCHPPSLLAFAMLRWFETQGGPPRRGSSQRGWLVGEKRLHARRAPGNTCLSALGKLQAAAELVIPSVEEPPNDSKGCGAVMRVAPCGLAAGSREQAFELARDSGVITHGHPSGYLSAAYFASLVWDLARGATLREAMGFADALLARERGSGELVRILAKARELARHGPPDAQTIESLGGGWTGEEALAIALACALTFEPESPHAVEHALWRAAAHSGDSDSTAAITGNLLGAMLGAKALPARWLATLELADVVEQLATDLHRAAIGGETLDTEDYPPN